MRMRKERGSGIVEGVVGLMLVIGGTVLCVLLLINSGAATYNKEKIGFVANQAATYAATLPSDSTRQALVTTTVNSLLESMGLSSTNCSVTVSDITVASNPAVSVTVSASLPTMLSSNFGNLLPQQIQMSDTAVAIKNAWFWAYGKGTLPDGQSVVCPLLNATGALPNDDKPAYAITVLGVTKIR
jgi:hypothetical protein